MHGDGAVEFFKKIIANIPQQEGRSAPEFIALGKEQFETYKCFTTNLTIRYEGGLEMFVRKV